MQNSPFHCQARFKLDPKVQREAQELHFSRPYPIHTHSVLEYYDMWNAQFSLRMTQQLKTRNDNQACWFPPPKAALSHVLPRDLCMSEISILWFNVRETVVMKVLLWLMAGSAVFFQGTLWIVFKCIYMKCSDVEACGEEAEHGDGGRSKTDFSSFSAQHGLLWSDAWIF